MIVRFPQEESGALRKLSRPWHGPYRVIEKNDPDIILAKVYFPQQRKIQVHQTRVQPCPPDWPNSYYWYGDKRDRPGRPPAWTKTVPSNSPSAARRMTDRVDEGKQKEETNQPAIVTSDPPRYNLRS